MSRGGTFHCPIGISLKRALILLADFTESEGARPTVAGRRRWRTRRCWRWRPVQPWSTGLCPSRSTNIRPNAGCPFLPDVIFEFRAMFVDSAFAILAGAVLSSGTGRRKFPWQRQRRTRPDIGGFLRTEYAADGTSPLQTHFWYRRVHTMGSWESWFHMDS